MKTKLDSLKLLVFLLSALMAMHCGKGTPSSSSFQILASTVWTRTDLMIPDESTVQIEAVGTISPNGHKYVDADGSSDENWVSSYNMYPGINHCALIAKVGPAGKVQFVGASRTIKVDKGGELLLGINDNDPENNEGTLDISVTIED